MTNATNTMANKIIPPARDDKGEPTESVFESAAAGVGVGKKVAVGNTSVVASGRTVATIVGVTGNGLGATPMNNFIPGEITELSAKPFSVCKFFMVVP